MHEQHAAFLAATERALWTPAMAEATRRKLIQEMGIDLVPEFAYKFIYKTNLHRTGAHMLLVQAAARIGKLQHHGMVLRQFLLHIL